MILSGARRSVFAMAVLALALCGCKSPQQRVEKHLEGIRAAWETNLVHQANLPRRQLDWPSAVELLIYKNPKLQQTRIDYTNAVENYRQIFRELIPTLNARAGVSKRLASLNTMSFDDVNFSADSFFNVPGLVNYAARIYAGKLVVLRARTAYQLAEREQMIELYRLFNGIQEQSLEMQRFGVQRAYTEAMNVIDPFTGRMMMTELETRETAASKELQTFQERASELFGDYSYKWELVTNGIPDLHYQIDPLPLSDTNRVAQLQMKLFALELEGARITLTGMKMRYWPELNIFVSGPPVYQRIAGRTRWWDATQVRGTADLYWSLDTRGYITRQLKQTRRSQAMQRQRFEQESLALIDRLLFTQQLMKTTEEQLERTNKEIELLLAIPPAQNFLSVQKYSEDFRQLTQQQLRLRRELAEFNALFWFMDEQAWPKPTAIPFQ